MEMKQEAPLDRAINRIRPSVRHEKPYIVARDPGEIHIKLNQNENPADLPAELKEKLIKAFFEVPFNRYPTEQPNRLQEAIGAHTGHDPAGILIGNGSNELTHTLGLALIEPGRPVVLPAPMFSLYTSVVRLFEGRPIQVPPLPDLRFDAAALLDAVQTHRPSLTILTTPNNPTGLSMPLSEIEPIVDAAADFGFVVVDEAYVEFTEETSAQTLLDRYPHLILVRTLSKAFGLAGLRIGYLMAHPAIIQELLKARLPFMIDRLSESVALALLEAPALLAERVAAMKKACGDITRALAAMPGVHVVPSQANFVLFKTERGGRDVMKQLAASGILVRDMSGYPELQGYLRVSAGLPEENKAFLSALERSLHTLASSA
ncbi:MAG: histidinol-phosphate transaminase [Rhodothermales bacterium]